jgi:3',5'-cyclic AMP phosphodiesterase CpdA
MRRIVHLSDIHFGRIDSSLVEPLIRCVEELKPNLVAVSGDLTQRARRDEFRAARDFLEKLPKPQLVVPGNHDVPLFNLLARWLFPLSGYSRYITRDLEPFYSDSEIAVVGVNTTRRMTRKDGRINPEQVGRIEEKLAGLSDEITKVLVSHHPFDIPPGHAERDLVGRAEMAMKTLARCGADLLLSGHLHLSRTTHSSERYKIDGHSALIVQAGTVSQRARGETNAFNVIEIDRPRIHVVRYEWNEDRAKFTRAGTEDFVRREAGWLPLHASS